MPYIAAPKRPGLWMRFFLWVTKKIAGRDMALPRLLAWSPKLALGSGILEATAVRPEGALTPRPLKLVRLDVSLRASCAFCLDMNSVASSETGISEEEIAALQGGVSPAQVLSFSPSERAALHFARAITATPIIVDGQIAAGTRKYFSEKEFLLIAATCAQVNYWARLAQGLGVDSEGFSQCKTDSTG